MGLESVAKRRVRAAHSSSSPKGGLTTKRPEPSIRCPSRAGEADLVAKAVREGGGKGGQHRAMRAARQDRIPQDQDADVPLAVDRSHLAGDRVVIGLHLIAWVDQHQPPARGGRGQGKGKLESVLLVDMGAPVGGGGAQVSDLLRMQLGQVDRVRLTQAKRRDQGGTGVSVRAKRGARLIQPDPVGVVLGKQRLGQTDARRRLTRLDRRFGGKVIDPAPGVGLDIAERLFLAGQVVQHPGQHRVLVDIGQVPGVVEVLIGQHGAQTYPALARLKSGNQLDPPVLWG